MDRPLVESMAPSASGLMATRRLDGELLWRSSSAAELFDQRIEADACPAQMRGMWSAAARSGAASALVVLPTEDGDAGFAVECHLLPAGVAGPEPVLCETYLRAASPGADASLTHDTDLEQVVGHAVIRLDLDGVVRSWSIGASRLKGYRAEDIIGRHFSTFYTADEAEERPAMLLAIAVRNGLARDVGWRMRADGSQFWCEVSINALRSPEGEVVGFLKVTRDLTQERARQTAQERLQRALAHDLRQPLGATYGYLALAREHLAAGEPGRADELVARAGAALERMGAMLDQLHSSVTRRMNADGGGRPRAMALPELVTEALGDLSSAHDRARVHQDLRTSTVFIDGIDGIRILTNLLANALRYSSGEVALRVVDDDETTVVTVTDQGRGIHPDDLPTIFELGARGRFAEDSDGGHGDGLTSVRQIVERYHGEVSICSEVEIGTTVSVRLPHEGRSPMLTVAADAAATPTTPAAHRTRLEV